MKIDVPEQVCDAHVHVGEYFGGIDQSFPFNLLFRIMKKFKIDKVLVSPGEVNPEVENARIIRETMKNKRIYGLIRTTPDNYIKQKYLKKLEKLFETNDKIVGLKINPSTERYQIVNPIYVNALELLNDHNLVLLVHCGRWTEMSGWHHVIPLAKRYRNINIIMAHMGGTHPDLAFPAIDAAQPLRNVFMDTSQTRQPVVLRRGIEKLGSNRILFGSDMPWGDYLQNIVGVLQLEENEDCLTEVLRENFRRLIE